jgi:hypothetical protein
MEIYYYKGGNGMSIRNSIEYEKPKNKLIWEYLEEEVKNSDRDTKLKLNSRGISIHTELNRVQLGFDVTVEELSNYCKDCDYESLEVNVDKYIISRMYAEYYKNN